VSSSCAAALLRQIRCQLRNFSSLITDGENEFYCAAAASATLPAAVFIAIEF
jgi:hypothetical protein